MNKVPLKVNAAVSTFEAARVKLLNFRQEHASIFLEYDELTEAYNEAVVAAKGAVRDHADSIDAPVGDFSVSTPVSISAILLRHILGDEEAADYVEPAPPVPEEKQWVVKVDAYRAAVGAGIIPVEVTEAVEQKLTPRVSGPAELGVFSLSGKKKSASKKR